MFFIPLPSMKNQDAPFVVTPANFSNNALDLYFLVEKVVTCTFKVSNRIP